MHDPMNALSARLVTCLLAATAAAGAPVDADREAAARVFLGVHIELQQQLGARVLLEDQARHQCRVLQLVGLLQFRGGLDQDLQVVPPPEPARLVHRRAPEFVGGIRVGLHRRLGSGLRPVFERLAAWS